MWSDPIADMLTRIRNGVRTHQKQVKMPNSRLKVGLARVLKDEGDIVGYDVVDDTKGGILRIHLKYGPKGEEVLDGLGISVVSTSQGVLSDRECRQKGIGGELLCTVY